MLAPVTTTSVFLVSNAECIAAGRSNLRSQQHMTQFRLRIGMDIMRGQIKSANAPNAHVARRAVQFSDHVSVKSINDKLCSRNVASTSKVKIRASTVGSTAAVKHSKKKRKPQALKVIHGNVRHTSDPKRLPPSRSIKSHFSDATDRGHRKPPGGCFEWR